MSDRVSRKHAMIRWDGRGFVLEDLGSSNGTQLNQEPVVQPTLLHADDRIRVGGFELTVRVLTGGSSIDDDEGGSTRRMDEGAVDTGSGDFTGNLSSLGIAALLEIVDWKQRSGRLHIEPLEGPAGTIYFQDGRVVHAQVGSVLGRNALPQLLGSKAGSFRLEQGKPDCPRSMNLSVDDVKESYLAP